MAEIRAAFGPARADDVQKYAARLARHLQGVAHRSRIDEILDDLAGAVTDCLLTGSWSAASHRQLYDTAADVYDLMARLSPGVRGTSRGTVKAEDLGFVQTLLELYNGGGAGQDVPDTWKESAHTRAELMRDMLTEHDRSMRSDMPRLLHLLAYSARAGDAAEIAESACAVLAATTTAHATFSFSQFAGHWRAAGSVAARVMQHGGRPVMGDAPAPPATDHRTRPRPSVRHQAATGEDRRP